MPLLDLENVPLAAHLASLAAVAALLFAAAPARADEQPFSPAETMTWECNYLGVGVGKAIIMVGGATQLEGQTVWPVIGLARTDPLFVMFPVKDKYVSWWSPERHVTLGSEFVADEKGKRRRERVRFDRDAKQALARREKEGLPLEEQTYDIPDGALDVMAAMLRVRELPLKPGDHVELPVFTGRKLFTLKIDVDGREPLSVPAGQFKTVALRVFVEFSGNLATKREIRMWVSDDARHVPVRMDAEMVLGHVVVDLIGYQKGVTSP